MQVLGGHAVIDTNDCTLEQAPEALDSHGMNVSVYESLGVAYRSMSSTASSGLVALEFIGDKQLSIDASEGVKERGKRFGFEVLDNFGDDVTASLFEPCDDLFTGSTTTTLSSAMSPGDVGVINFNDTSEFILEVVAGTHSLTDLHRHAPRGFVGDSDGTFDLFSRNAFLAFDHQPDCDKPLGERGPASMEDRAASDGELMGASGALPNLPFFDPVRMNRPASWTSDTIGPAHLAKKDLAFVLGGESFVNIDNVYANLLYKEYSTNSGLSQGDKA